MRKKTIQKMTTVAILAALSVVFYMFLKFPLPFIFPSFLDIQFSNLPVILAGLIFGPSEALIVVIIRFLVKAPFSSTAYVGEVADLVIGYLVGTFTSFIYHRNRTKKGGIIALIVGAIVWVVGAIIINSVVLLPWYINTYGMEAVFGMLKIIPGISESNYMLYYVLFAVIPFNALLAAIVCCITFFVYKRISLIYKEETEGKDPNTITEHRTYVGSLLIIMDVIILVGYLMLSKEKFIVSDSQPIYMVVLKIMIYIAIFVAGLILILRDKIKNNRIRNKEI